VLSRLAVFRYATERWTEWSAKHRMKSCSRLKRERETGISFQNTAGPFRATAAPPKPHTVPSQNDKTPGKGQISDHCGSDQARNPRFHFVEVNLCLAACSGNALDELHLKTTTLPLLGPQPRGCSPLNLSAPLQILLCPEKFLLHLFVLYYTYFKHIYCNENKHTAPKKCILPPKL